ncbi:hypothetical protein G9A89_015307 [Geosiphon pyriformis]|nr:hypothetical protein G9A89_015307 [Geosiphon pyriformis]
MGKITRSKSYSDQRTQDINGAPPRTKPRPRRIDLTAVAEIESTESATEDTSPEIIVPIPKRFVPQELTERVEQQTRDDIIPDVPQVIIGHSRLHNERAQPARTNPEPRIPPPRATPTPTPIPNFHYSGAPSLPGQHPMPENGNIAPDGNITTTTTVTIKLTTVTTTNPTNGATTTSVFTEIVPVTTAANNSNDDATVTFQQMEPTFTPMSPKISSIPNYNPIANNTNLKNGISSGDIHSSGSNTANPNSPIVSRRNSLGPSSTEAFNQPSIGNPSNSNSQISSRMSTRSVTPPRRSTENTNSLPKDQCDNEIDRDGDRIPLSIMPHENPLEKTAGSFENSGSNNAGTTILETAMPFNPIAQMTNSPPNSNEDTHFSHSPDQNDHHMNQMPLPNTEHAPHFKEDSSLTQEPSPFIDAPSPRGSASSFMDISNLTKDTSSSSYFKPLEQTISHQPYIESSKPIDDMQVFVNTSNSTINNSSFNDTLGQTRDLSHSFLNKANNIETPSSFINSPTSTDTPMSILNNSNPIEVASSYINASSPNNMTASYLHSSNPIDHSNPSSITPNSSQFNASSINNLTSRPIGDFAVNTAFSSYIPPSPREYETNRKREYNSSPISSYVGISTNNYTEAPSHDSLFVQKQGLEEVKSSSSGGTLNSMSSLTPAMVIPSQSINIYRETQSSAEDRKNTDIVDNLNIEVNAEDRNKGDFISPRDNPRQEDKKESFDGYFDDRSISKSLSSYPDTLVSSTSTARPRYYRLPELGTLQTVYDVWNEWNTGLNGNPSIQDMLARYGNKWASDNGARLIRRKKIVKEIKRRLKELTDEQAILDSLEAMRAGNSLNWLYDQLGQAQRKR